MPRYGGRAPSWRDTGQLSLLKHSITASSYAQQHPARKNLPPVSCEDKPKTLQLAKASSRQLLCLKPHLGREARRCRWDIKRPSASLSTDSHIFRLEESVLGIQPDLPCGTAQGTSPNNCTSSACCPRKDIQPQL